MTKYPLFVYDNVKDFAIENLNEAWTKADIDNLKRADVLGYYLEWEGIIGYTYFIKSIMGYYELQDFIDELISNMKVNIDKGLENRIDIDYVIQRLKELL